jgi:hypothetical protein
MSGLFHALIVIAVIAFAAVRQLSAQRIADDKRWWILPVILLFISVREADAPRPGHEALSAVILGAGFVVALVTGAGWGWTARLWRGTDSSVWSEGTRATVSVWATGLVLGASLAGAAVLLGIHQDVTSVMMTLALMLFARSGVLTWRAQGVRQSQGAAAEGTPSRPVLKDLA